MSNFEDLKAEIFALRWGVVHFDIRALDKPQSDQIDRLLDSYVEQLGMHGISGAWREIDSSSARRIIHKILHRDLAYNTELMSEIEAMNLSYRVMNLFSLKSRYFTNGNFDEDRTSVKSGQVVKGFGWHPITDATFDTGVMFVNGSKIGLIWVEDED